MEMELDSVVVIDIESAIDNAKYYEYEDMVDSIKIILLETNESSMLSNIIEVVVGDEFIYTIDQYQGGRVSIFDLNGKFIRSIPKGQAPEETVSASSICYNKEYKHLYVYDIVTSKIIKFTSDGRYLSHNYLEGRQIRQIATVDTSLLIAKHYKNEFQIARIDTMLGNMELWQLGDDDYNCLINFFQSYDKGLNVSKLLDNKIYYYKNNELSPKYIIEYNIPKIDPLLYDRDIRAMSGDIPDNSYLYLGRNYELKDYLIVEMCMKGGVSKRIFYNKNNKQSWIRKVKYQSLFNYIIIDYFYKSDGNWLMGIIDTEFFTRQDYRWDGSNIGGLISDADMEKLRNVKPDDNPIIVLFKLKDEI